MSGLPFSTSSLMSLLYNEGLWFISFSLCSFHQLPAKCSNLGRDVSLYQVVSLLFNKLSSHVDNTTCEIPSPALFPREEKSIFIEKAALEQCREFMSSLVLPLGLPQTEWGRFGGCRLVLGLLPSTGRGLNPSSPLCNYSRVQLP